MNKAIKYQLEKNGNIKANYYIYKAHELRSLYIKKALLGMKNKLTALFHVKLPTINLDQPVNH